MTKITKSANGWMVDGLEASLDRDGVTLRRASVAAPVLAVASIEQIASLIAEDEAGRRGRAAPRISRERSFDRGYNEGGEGYNPYRYGSKSTYRR